MAKDSFIIYTKYGEQVSLLSDVQAGILLKALFKHQQGESLPKMDAITNIVFSVFRQNIDEENASYNHICEVNKANGKRGGRPAKSLTDKGNKPEKPSGLFENRNNRTVLECNQNNRAVFQEENPLQEKVTQKENIPQEEYTPFFISPTGGKKTNYADEFFAKYPRYAKDRDKMRVDVDYKRLLEEFEKSTYLRSLYTVKQINEAYPCIIAGDYRDAEKKPSSIADADARAERERWYSFRRNKALAEAEKIHATFMKDEMFAKIVKRLRAIDIEQAKAEARGDRAKCAKLEQEKMRLKLQKQGIIERNGMTEEDLEPKWQCKKCEDTGFVDGYPCDCYEG